MGQGNSPALSKQATIRPIDEALIEHGVRRLRADRSFRQRLEPSGEIAIERPLPFLFVHRSNGGSRADEVPTLLRDHACFIEAPDCESTRALVSAVARELSSLFGGVLVIELWAGAAPAVSPEAGPSPATFRICSEPEFANSSTVLELINELQHIVLYQQPAKVSFEGAERIAPPGVEALLPARSARDFKAALLGVDVGAVYRDAQTSAIYPIARRNLRRQVGTAFRRSIFEFSRHETRHHADHFEALGRRSFTKLVWEIDRAICAISEKFDLLLTTTPVNGQSAYAEFEATRFERAPQLLYRPRTIDPPLLKRELYRLPIERVADTTLSYLFEEKRRELDLKLTMVEELHTRRFLPTSLALYGRVDSNLVEEARALLERYPASSPPTPSVKIDATTFAARAEALLGRLREVAPGLTSSVELRSDISSLTVSSGNLLVGSAMTFSEDRAEALLQHEVGTHVVTHWNGCHQPLALLSAGLAGYDELQEGLAVFAEYLVGGLNPLRLRTLAGRVVAARSMSEGASFVETFHELTDDYGFGPRAAFTNTLRVHRGGGFVKDAVYLRGLRSVLEFVRDGGKLESLLIGKVATDHAEMIEELQQREILKPLALNPTYLSDPASRDRLEKVRSGLGLERLAERSGPDDS